MKHFFAFFMLFVYGLSFAHDFIPHHTHDLQDVHEHHSDTHNHDDNSSHNHIQHDNHVDEGLLDYLSCVLADHEHNPAQECSYSETITNQKNNSQQQLKTVLSSVNSQLVLVDLGTLNLYPSAKHFDATYFNKLCCKRGPPSFI